MERTLIVDAEQNVFPAPFLEISPDAQYSVREKIQSENSPIPTTHKTHGYMEIESAQHSNNRKQIYSWKSDRQLSTYQKTNDGKLKHGTAKTKHLNRSPLTTMSVSSIPSPNPPNRPSSLDRRVEAGHPTPKGISLSLADDTLYNIDRHHQIGKNIATSSTRSRQPSRFLDRTVQPGEGWDKIPAEDKVKNYTAESLRDCSRQRLRAVHWSMRQYGNVQARINLKDLQQAFQENEVELPNRVFQTLVDRHEDIHGINYENMYRYLVDAHTLSGRDSVLAMYHSNEEDNTRHNSCVRTMYKEADLIQRIQDLLIREKTLFDLTGIKEALQEKDKNKSGSIAKREVLDICKDYRLVLYGALLKNLINYCDDIKIGLICWSEFLGFLEKAQQAVLVLYPDLQCSPRQPHDKEPVEPEPIDELSWGTRSRLTKLLKKASMHKTGNAEKKTAGDVCLSSTEIQKENKNIAGTKKEEVLDQRNHLQNSDNNSTVGTLVKGSSGIFTSMKAFIRGKRNDNETNPLLKETPTKDTFTQFKEVEGTQGNSNSDDISVNIHNKKVHFQKLPIEENKNGDKTTQNLNLHWIYGYRGNDCRRNIYIVYSGEMLYFMANIAVLYNMDTHKQRLYREHNQNIKCMALHSNNITVATGQFSGKHETVDMAQVRIWRCDTLQTLHILADGKFQNTVMHIAFAVDKNIIATIDNSSDKQLAIWNTESRSLVAEVKLNIEVICDVSFSLKAEDVFVTIGKEHLAWWRLSNNRIERMPEPDYGNFLKARFVTCSLHTENGDLLTGDSNGTIFIWENGDNKITNAIEHGHQGPIFSLLSVPNYLVSGGRDGCVRMWQWNKNMDSAGSCQIPHCEGGVRMLQIHKTIILIGTTVNSILRAELPNHDIPLDNNALTTRPLTQGHFDDVSCLSVIRSVKSNIDLVTAGTDGLICFYDTANALSLEKVMLKESCFTCVEYNDSIHCIALGTKDGSIVILDVDNVNELMIYSVCQDKITSVTFSPDGTSIAISGGITVVHVFRQTMKDGTQQWVSHGICEGHSDDVTSMEWSKITHEGEYILKITTTNEEVFWKISTMEKMSVDAVQSVSWKTEGDPVLELTGMDKPSGIIDYNTTCAIVASASMGFLNLYRLPYGLQPIPLCTQSCHGKVADLKFSASGRFLLTVGRESALMQWEVA